ncbi:DNA-3-methyladenine glycosylase 2 family protein [Isoptericola sp. NEAU-Y5]|uniref:DNA-3-methyladenine glycosylase 2 family protein n=1 Tax=Isoptericola luteus TaxID=2879484 RepID=A0ABS7ZBP8_9MICO|nr:DNA-3-methyladenine glycosylase 2 family protein [Isoptericola sp. NEAU-Y5]MCA5891892.1 DNA-3-methyladenine glycosylase 2 family protein [Isoptericola sp. NEAU-Y5]
MTEIRSADALTVRHLSDRPLDLGPTLAPLRHGVGDPTFTRTTDGAVWRTTLLPSGPATQRFVADGERSVVVQQWGPGAREAADRLPQLLGEDDSTDGFVAPPQAQAAARRAVGLRITRSGRVMEALVPAVLEQKVQVVTAHRAWRHLVLRRGSAAPGPAPAGLRVVPDARTWAALPVWEWHRAGVDPRRAATVARCARVAARLEETATLPGAEARARLEAVPGIGEWTSAEVAQRALGDADAVSVGDFHLAAAVGWALTGERTDDAGMLELLAPYAPHRHRVVRLLFLDRRAQAPRRGPRLPIPDYRGL